MNGVFTDHEQRDGEVLPAAGLHGAEDGSHDGAADAHEGDHHDEPADGHRLRHHHAAARLWLLLARVMAARSAAKQYLNSNTSHLQLFLKSEITET